MKILSFNIITDANILTFGFDFSHSHVANIAEVADMSPATRNSEISIHQNSRGLAFRNVIGNKMTNFFHFFLVHKKEFGFPVFFDKLVAQILDICFQLFFVQPIKTSGVFNIGAFWKVIALSGHPIEFQRGNGHINDMTGGVYTAMKCATRFVHRAFHFFANLKTAGLIFSDMFYHAVHEAHFLYKELSRRLFNNAFVVWLSSALRIKNCLIQNDNLLAVFLRYLENFTVRSEEIEIFEVK